MRTAAVLATAGMDPMRFFDSKDPEEIEFMIATAQEFLDLKDDLDRNLAGHGFKCS